MDINSFIYFNAAIIITAVPRAIKIFSLFASIYGGSLKSYTLGYDIIFFIILLTLRGFSGIISLNAFIEILFNDIYYVVSHFHAVWSLGAIYMVVIYYIIYIVYILGKEYNEGLSRIQKNRLIIVSFSSSIPVHILGFYLISRGYNKYSLEY